MTIQNKELWLEMYKAAERVRDLEAWNWMYEDDMVAVVDPTNPENIGFCSLMGAGGEFSALAIYQGIEGLYTWSDLREAGEESPDGTSQMNLMLLQKCWMIEFTDADGLCVSSKETLKALGLKYRGAGKWIDISNREPGVFPWYVDEEDVPFITTCINQFFDVALRAEDDESILSKPNPDYKELDFDEEEMEEGAMEEMIAQMEESEDLMIKRSATEQKDGKWLWEDSYFDPFNSNLYEMPIQRITPSIRAVALGKKLKVKEAAILIGFLMLPTPMQEDKKEAPFFACVNFFIQYGSGMILNQEISRYSEAKGKFEKAMLDLFEKIGFIPSQIVTNMPVVMDWLDSFEELYEIETILAPDDEAFEQVFSGMKNLGLY